MMISTSQAPKINTSNRKLSVFQGNSRSFLKRRTMLFRYFAEINLLLGFWYLQWRVFNSLNYDALWLAVPLLLAEIYSYFGGVLFTLGMWRPIERQTKPLEEMSPALPVADWPTVDALITCYNESAEMVEATARAALAIDYPVTKLIVYILDDGNSPQMREMAQRLCMEDMQSPPLRAAAKQIQTEQQELVDRLEILRQLMPDTVAAEKFLASAPASGQGAPLAIRLLHNFHKLLLIKDHKHETVEAQVWAEQERLEQAVLQKQMELSALARCRYIARPKPAGKPHHAKAGNINYAIFAGETTGKFIITLDADHIPRPQFLKHVLPYFVTYNSWNGKYEDNRIALVQTPQDFSNLPPGDPYGHQAHLFYGPIQQGKDGLNSAFYTGTNAVLRREAIVNTGLKYFAQAYAQDEKSLDEFDLIGGVSSSSITEDMNTAMRLHAAGWQSIYHNELLAIGLAPDDLSSTLQQRLRWAQGTIQVMTQENPLTKPGLSFWQRLQYFQTMYSYFSGFAMAVFLICPIVFFFTGAVPVVAYGNDFVRHFLPAFIFNRVTFLIIGWGIPARELWRSEQYALSLFPLFIQAVWSVISKRPIHFKVTPKERQSGIYFNLIKPQLIIFGLTSAGIAWNLGLFIFGKLHDPLASLVNIGWSIYNMSLLWSVIGAAMWKPKSTN